MKTTGRKVLITGAGTGMGLEAAKRFSDLGSRVIMVARNADRLRTEAARLPGAIAFPGDISNEEQVARLVKSVVAEHPDLDTVLLNAGVTHTYKLFGMEDAPAHAEVEMRTNYLSAVRLIDGFVPLLRRQADPALIVTTSGVAFAPDITNPTYSATKAALHSLTQSVRLQLERDGSPVSVFEFMAPLVDSPFSAAVISEQKVSASDAVAELFDALERDEFELHAGLTKDIYEALRSSSDAAVRAVNAATGG
ncbi:SDR family oxidoreductase [Streptomyces sp. NBC_01497]|uniref:SDR family oxidoreductase n=1 Tax=Streptomyces sp. NBC_01497 TaxID=2903885 RepID=UPI002E344601|nr:SDR family NAD(P)-dependent oxidoreductase [Streptomyces sp. NBC_01497]